MVRVVRVVSGVSGGDAKDSTDPTHTHVSETQLDTVEPDVVVQNDSTVDTLQRKISDLMTTRRFSTTTASPIFSAGSFP